jgi:hypothetical protein
MAVSPVIQQAIDIYAKTQQTRSDIATAVLTKQIDASKQQGEAALKLLDQAASTPSRGIDVRA